MTRNVDVLMKELAEGRTDMVFELFNAGVPPESQDEDGGSLLRWCAYYGDVSAIKFLLSNGADLAALGANFGLNGASFHGHWRLSKFLLEQGANANAADDENGETPLHSALCTADRVQHDNVLQVLLSFGANPNATTKIGMDSGGFMRDARTKGETPLHRAAAFGNENTIDMLLQSGAQVDARDAHGDSALSWASWYLRPDSILRLLCFGDFNIRSGRKSMQASLVGSPLSPPSTV